MFIVTIERASKFTLAKTLSYYFLSATVLITFVKMAEKVRF
jgi:hypothetical protein